MQFVGKVDVYLNRSLGSLAAIWGILGVLTLLGFAIWRMAGHMLDATSFQLGITHYIVGALWTVFMAYSEGYKGFQKSFSPRVASRAVYLKEHCTGLRFALAPFFCIGYFHATRKRIITVTVLIAMITLIVILFRYIPQPWRGVLDFGVIVGLSWGVTATLCYFVKFWFAKEVTHDPEVFVNGKMESGSGSSNA